MTSDGLSDIIMKHLAADVKMKPAYVNEADPNAYLSRRHNFTRTGALLLENGNLADAIVYFYNACREDADDFWARFYIGSLALDLNEPALGNALLRYCLEKSPPDWTARAMALANLGSCQLKLGDFSSAESSLDEAIKLQPDLDGAYYLKGIHYFYSGETEKALQCVKAGLSHSPDSLLLKHLELDFEESKRYQKQK